MTPADDIVPGWQFASDNTSGLCPEAYAALAAANVGYAPSYGSDPWTERACELIRQLFERPDAEVFFVLNGTASNSLLLASLAHSFEGVACHEVSHINTDECSAPEFFSGGAKLQALPGADAKLSVAALRNLLRNHLPLHAARPRVLSLSQTTEWGTVYQPSEIVQLADVAHEHGMRVHMDGARFVNALAALAPCSPADLTWRAGVDVLSLGGTKNGLNTTEAVVFFDAALAQLFDYRCKQGGQLASKMRFQSCQWQAVLESGAWQRHGAHANAMARRLAQALRAINGIELARAVEANAVFVRMDARMADALTTRGWHFHEISGGGYRFMCSWATQMAEIECLVRDVSRLTAAHSAV